MFSSTLVAVCFTVDGADPKAPYILSYHGNT